MSLLPRPLCLAFGAAMAAAMAPAQAQDRRPVSAYVQAGGGHHGLRAASVGLAWPWAWRHTAWGGEFTAHTELFASYWQARDVAGGDQGFVQLGLVPMLRYRLGEGRSRWFVEAGIGLSVMDKRYLTPFKTFSTRLNFSDSLALGLSLGEQRRHELSLRLQHTSNAGIKRPNPGENLMLVRYAMLF